MLLWVLLSPWKCSFTLLVLLWYAIQMTTQKACYSNSHFFKIKSSFLVMLEHMHCRNARAPELKIIALRHIASMAYVHVMSWYYQYESLDYLEETVEYFHRYIFIFARLQNLCYRNFLPMYMGHQRKTMGDVYVNVSSHNKGPNN